MSKKKKSTKKRKAVKKRVKFVSNKIGLSKGTCYGCNITKPCITHSTLNDPGNLCVPCTKLFIKDVTAYFEKNKGVEGVLVKAIRLRKDAVNLEVSVGYTANSICTFCGEDEDRCECGYDEKD